MSGHSGRSRDEKLAAEALERFRQTGIRLDREGRFWHEGGEVEHEGMRRAFLSWMDRLDDGRPILRLDDERYVYIDVDDAALLVTAVRWRADRAFITLNDGTEPELAYDTLAVGDDDAMYCRVKNKFGRWLDARLTTQAYYALAERVEQRPDGSFALRAAGERHPIGTR